MSTARAEAYTLYAVRFEMVRETVPQIEPRTIRHAKDAGDLLLRLIGGKDREHFVALALNTQHEVTAAHVVSIGGLAGAPVHPREVFKFAIAMSAAAVIIGHNHPSGNPEPSHDDILITEQLRAAGRLLGIEVLDHIIVGERRTISLREERKGFG